MPQPKTPRSFAKSGPFTSDIMQAVEAAIRAMTWVKSPLHAPDAVQGSYDGRYKEPDGVLWTATVVSFRAGNAIGFDGAITKSHDGFIMHLTPELAALGFGLAANPPAEPK